MSIKSTLEFKLKNIKSEFKSGLDFAGQKLENGVNYALSGIWGYGIEQGFSTFNVLTFDALEYYNNKLIERAEAKGKEIVYATYDSDDEVENSRESFGWKGFAAGVVQDLVTVGLSIGYLCGNDSHLAHIASGVAVAKVGLNVVSLAAQGVYLRAMKFNEEYTRQMEDEARIGSD